MEIYYGACCYGECRLWCYGEFAVYHEWSLTLIVNERVGGDGVVFQGVGIPCPSIEVDSLLTAALEVEGYVVLHLLWFYGIVFLLRCYLHPYPKGVAGAQLDGGGETVVGIGTDVHTIDIDPEARLLCTTTLLNRGDAHAVARVVVHHKLLGRRGHLGEYGIE